MSRSRLLLAAIAAAVPVLAAFVCGGDHEGSGAHPFDAETDEHPTSRARTSRVAPAAA